MDDISFLEQAPTDSHLTAYDRERLGNYLRLLDAEACGADWKEVAHVVLGVDPQNDPKRCKRMYDSHLARARWISAQGFANLVWHSTSRTNRLI
ncbi:DNA -binding domain-containing protein [Sphingomonas sp. DC1600-2]|uniref:DNA -binding domain-containing protein n=1 Tax=unclassified Sphingomonas TaxID=196159 RepID=UPI003CED6167